MDDQNTNISGQGHYSTSAHFSGVSDFSNTKNQGFLTPDDSYNLDVDLLDNPFGDNLVDDDLDDGVDSQLDNTNEAPKNFPEAQSEPWPKHVSLGSGTLATNDPPDPSTGGKCFPGASIGLGLDEPLPPQDVVDDL